MESFKGGELGGPFVCHASLEDVNAQLEFRKTELPGIEEIKYYVKDSRAFLEKEEFPER